MQNKVSIIIPCYNYGQYLAEAIDSAMNQTIDCEVIVVDDGSTDNTKNIALNWSLAPNFTYVYKENAGVAEARNTGIKMSTGTHIICLDADDKLSLDYAEKCLHAIQTHGICATGIQLFGEFDIYYPPNDVTLEKELKNNLIYSSAMFLKKCWEEVKGYHTMGYEDWDFWLMILEKGYTVGKADTKYFYRKHGESMVDDFARNDAKYKEVLHKRHKSMI